MNHNKKARIVYIDFVHLTATEQHQNIYGILFGKHLSLFRMQSKVMLQSQFIVLLLLPFALVLSLEQVVEGYQHQQHYHLIDPMNYHS